MQLPIGIAKRDKADVGTAKGVDRQHVASVRRRIGAHLGELMIEQFAHIRMVELAFEEMQFALNAIHGTRDVNPAVMVGSC